MRKLIREVGEEEVGLLLEACSKHSYVGAHRKCEVTVKNLASFFPNWNMTRACIVWFDHELKEASLRPESLEDLYLQRGKGGHAEIEPKSTKADFDSSVFGQTRVISPLTGKGEVIVAPGNALLKYERHIRMSDPELRKRTFIFSFSNGQPLTADIYCEFLYHMIWRATKHMGQNLSIEQVEEEYSGHSLRIGSINAMKEAVLPDGSRISYEERLTQARFRSSNHPDTAMYVYVRRCAPRLISCMKAMLNTRVRMGQTIAPDLPAYPAARAMDDEKGTYIVREDDTLDAGLGKGPTVIDPKPSLQRIEQNNRNELNSILKLEVAANGNEILETSIAKRFLVPTIALSNGKRKREGRYWKGHVEKIVMSDKYPVKIKFEDGMTEEWDIDAFRKGRETYRKEYPEEWIEKFPCEK